MCDTYPLSDYQAAISFQKIAIRKQKYQEALESFTEKDKHLLIGLISLNLPIFFNLYNEEIVTAKLLPFVVNWDYDPKKPHLSPALLFRDVLITKYQHTSGPSKGKPLHTKFGICLAKYIPDHETEITTVKEDWEFFPCLKKEILSSMDDSTRQDLLFKQELDFCYLLIHLWKG